MRQVVVHRYPYAHHIALLSKEGVHQAIYQAAAERDHPGSDPDDNKGNDDDDDGGDDKNSADHEKAEKGQKEGGTAQQQQYELYDLLGLGVLIVICLAGCGLYRLCKLYLHQPEPTDEEKEGGAGIDVEFDRLQEDPQDIAALESPTTTVHGPDERKSLVHQDNV